MNLLKIREKLSNVNYEAILLTNSENEVSGKNLKYATGFTGTSGYALIGKEYAYFITDFRYTQQARNQVQGYDFVERTRPVTEILNELISKHEIKNLGFDKKILYSEYELYSNRLECTLVPMDNFIEDLRISKSEDELAIMQKAADIADLAFEHILTFIKPGVTEIEIAQELLNVMKNHGASGPSFDFIVASGVRGALPHGVATDKKVEVGELVTMDFGCYYKGYASDITRTVAVGEVSDKHKEIYNIVLEAQKRGVAAVKAGLTGKEIDAVCRDYIASFGYGPNFGHSTGHGLGLDVHENPSVSSLNNTPIQVGNVITIEPGIYIDGFGGVRIEDDVVVTGNGHIVLNKSPKELIIL